MYPNLKAEMARRGLKLDSVAAALNITASSLSQKLRGMYPFTLNEAKKIKTFLGVDMTLEELFKEAG